MGPVVVSILVLVLGACPGNLSWELALGACPGSWSWERGRERDRERERDCVEYASCGADQPSSS